MQIYIVRSTGDGLDLNGFNKEENNKKVIDVSKINKSVGMSNTVLVLKKMKK